MNTYHEDCSGIRPAGDSPKTEASRNRAMTRNDSLLPVLPDIPRDNSFNAIRFFLCVVVIVMHCWGLSGVNREYARYFDGHTAVRGFFVLSGFWVTRSYLLGNGMREFAAKRPRRLLPMYWLTVLGAAVALSFFSALPAREYFSDAGFYKYLAWNGVFLNFMHHTLPGVFEGCQAGGAVNGALWTIKVEVGFYIVLPMLVALLKRISSPAGRNLLLGVIYIVSVGWSFVQGHYAGQVHWLRHLNIPLLGCMSCFVCGMACVLNWNWLKRMEKWLILPAVALLALHYVTRTSFLLPAALTVVVFFVGTRFRFLSRIGQPVDYSYCMYLFLFPLVQLFTQLGFFQLGPKTTCMSLLAMLLGLAFMEEKYIQPLFSPRH